MDGVLVDTEPIYFLANQVTFSELGFSVSSEENAQFIGLDAYRMWEILKRQHNLRQSISDLVLIEKNGLQNALDELDLKRMPGLSKLLKALKQAGFQLALASTSGHSIIDTILERLELTADFPIRLSGEDVRKGKPDPEIFLATAARLNLPPGSCTVIEDSKNGVSAAIAAGMRCVGFDNSSSNYQDLSLSEFDRPWL